MMSMLIQKRSGSSTQAAGHGGSRQRGEAGKYAIMSPVKASAFAVAGTKPAEDYCIHTVVHGDTLRKLAKKYLGNRYTEIVSLNGLKSNAIYSGMGL